jgi:hypothetical protein
MHAKFGWVMVAGVVLAGSMAIVVQYRAAAVLRAEVDRARAEAQALEKVRTEHERLLATQPAAGEIEQTAANGELLTQVRTEVKGLRQAEMAARADADKKLAAARFAVGAKVPASEWKNAGNATPIATFETALWAGAGGDVDAFAKTLLLFGGPVQRAAQALLDSLPDSRRAQFGSPERLIAFLTIKDVPLGAVEVRQSTEMNGWPLPAQTMQVLLTAADGKQRDTTLVFMNPGDGWKLVVLESVVAKYAAMLKEPEAAAGGK